MKHYKDLDAFEKRVRMSTDWDDYFMLGGRMYTLYEYGPGPGVDGPNYACFRNARSGDMITVRYNLPRVQYRDGVRTEEGEYRFIEMDFEPNAYAWR